MFYLHILNENERLAQCYRSRVLHTHPEEEDVQISVWSVCVDTHDSHYGIHAVIVHCSQHF